VYRSSLMTFPTRQNSVAAHGFSSRAKTIRPHSTRRKSAARTPFTDLADRVGDTSSSHPPRSISRVGVDPISDPDTAIMEILLAALGRPNFTGQDRHTYCAHCDFGCTELRGQDRSR
jgi:hypothetical protein